MDVSVARIAVVQGAPGHVIQDLFHALVDRWSPALRIAGVIAEGHGLPDRACNAGYLRRIGHGDRFSIFEDQGPGAAGCHLDAGGAAAAATAVREDIVGACDLAVLSKFGKLEATGKGLWTAFTAAAEARTPLLTSVSRGAATAWQKFAGCGFIVLPAEDAAIDAWLETIRSHARRPESRTDRSAGDRF